jgi:hypothetical protein
MKMKNKIKKADMRGQFIDMQKTRGGRPARLFRVCLRRCDVKRINVPYVVGRIGWFYRGKRLKPVDGIFVHCTDLKKAEAYENCFRFIHDWLYFDGGNGLERRLDSFKADVSRWGFTFPKSLQKTVKELMS